MSTLFHEVISRVLNATLCETWPSLELLPSLTDPGSLWSGLVLLKELVDIRWHGNYESTHRAQGRSSSKLAAGTQRGWNTNKLSPKQVSPQLACSHRHLALGERAGMNTTFCLSGKKSCSHWWWSKIFHIVDGFVLSCWDIYWVSVSTFLCDAAR